MVPISRRKLLAASGIAAVAGCMSTAPDDTADGGSTNTDTDAETDATTTEAETDEDDTLPDDLVRALEPLPATIDDEPPGQVIVSAPTDDDTQFAYVGNAGEEFGIDPAAVDRTATATYGDGGNSVVTVVGTFDAGAVSSPDNFAVTVEDGRIVGAGRSGGNDDGDGWNAGLDAAENAAASADAGLIASDGVESVLTPVADETWINLLATFPPEQATGLPDELDADAIDAVAVAQTRVAERTTRLTYVFLFEDESAVDTDALETFLDGTLGQGDLSDRSVDRDGRRGVVSVVRERPPQPDHEASPDARFRIEYDDETGEATLEHGGEEAVDADALTLLIDGEPAEAAWTDEYDTVEAGDALTLPTDPFTHLRVRWDDPDSEDTFDYIGGGVAVDRSVFAASYDRSSSRLTITYEGEQSADTSRLQLRHRSDGGRGGNEPDETPVSEHHDRLTTGDEIVVDDVEFGDRVHMMVRVEGDNWGMASSFFHFAARPPGQFTVERENATTNLVYRGTSRNAVAEAAVDEFRVLVDGEPAATQWADEHDELAAGDRLTVDAAPGDEVTVEWTGGDEAATVTERTVVPDVSIAVEESGDGGVTLTHDGGESVDANRLTIRFAGGSGGPVAWGDEGETVEPGDATTVDAPDDARHVVVLYDDKHVDHAELGDE